MHSKNVSARSPPDLVFPLVYGVGKNIPEIDKISPGVHWRVSSPLQCIVNVLGTCPIGTCSD